jgi:hypothetical protein
MVTVGLPPQADKTIVNMNRDNAFPAKTFMEVFFIDVSLGKVKRVVVTAERTLSSIESSLSCE